jgi:hypothetical protein
MWQESISHERLSASGENIWGLCDTDGGQVKEEHTCAQLPSHARSLIPVEATGLGSVLAICCEVRREKGVVGKRIHCFLFSVSSCGDAGIGEMGKWRRGQDETKTRTRERKRTDRAIGSSHIRFGSQTVSPCCQFIRVKVGSNR